ncbi:hypothetical protein ACHWQZ_G011320 [Mnemiopsis leidyi]
MKNCIKTSQSPAKTRSDSETALYLYEQATICSKLRSTLDTSSLVESYRSDTHPLSVLTKCRRTANRTINRESRGGYNDSPRDTQADDKNNKPANTTDNSTNSNVSQSRRNNVSGRGALFDGSRGRKLTTGSDDDGEDDEDKKVRQKLLNQCEASSSTSDPLPKVKLKEDNNEAENPRTAAPDPNTNTELAKLDNSRPENWVISPIALINRDAKQTPRQRSNPNVNSTALDQSHAGYHLFDTSLLQGISRIWQSARNVSLFGTSYSRQNTSLGSNQVERIRANPATDESFGSDLEDQLPDISDISLDVLQNQTVVEHIKTAQNQPEGSGKDTHQAHAPESDCFVGVANPEITPVAFHVRESRTFFTPLNRSGSKIRTKSECSPFVRNGPYELPHSVIVRKSKRTEIRFNLLDNRSDQTPIGRRKRTASESFNFNSSQGNLEINCIRAREPGLYDCSSGLGEYVHLEHMFLDKADTGRIDKRKLLESVEKFLTITGDQQSQGLPNTVKLSWDDEEVLEASGNLSTHLAHHIDQRKNLVFLLGRMINHATRLTGKRLTYNGINLTVLPDQTKVPLKCPENCPDQPIVALYIGKGIDVNIVPKKRDWVRPNVHDIHMENFSLLTIFPETISHMNISIPEVREETETHLLITPYFIDHSDEVPKENRSASSKETEIGINSVQVEGRTPAQNPDATEPPAVNEELVDNSINTSCLKDDYDNEKLAPVLNPEQQGNCKGDIAHNDSTENTTGLVVQSGQTSVEVEVLTEKPDAVHPKANNIEQNDLDDPDLRKKEENGCLTISSGKLKPTNHRDSNETDIGESEPNKVLLTDDTARTDFTTCRAKPFISKETIVNICNGNSGNKITDWLKLCNLRLGHTAEANRKIILDHLSRAAEGKVKLPPLLVEKLVKRLKIEAVTTELINIGLDLPKNAAKRKSTLAMYLTSEFTTLNVSDYNETCDLERSRLGTNKSYLKGFQKSHKAKAPKSKKKSKARKPKSVSDKPVEHSPENYKSGPSPGNETGKTSVVMCPGNRIAEIEMTGATSDPAIKIIEASGKDDKKMTLTERMNEVLAAKDLNLDDTANIRMNNNSNDDAAKRLQNRVATKKDATDRVHTRSKNKDPLKGLNENAGKKLEGDPDEKPKSESVAKTKRKDIPEKRSDKPGKGITSATERGNKEEPKAKVKKAKSDMISPQGTHKSSSARTEKLTSVKNKESIDPKDKKKQNRKETTPKETDTENVFHPPSSADKENHPRDFEKPLRTLEASLLKLQDNINAQSEQITLLSAKVLAPDRNPEKINHNADLLDLRSKVDTLLKTIEVQQETLLQLTESKESQKQHFSVFPCNNYDTPCPDCQQCKEEISELKATVSSLRKDFMVLKRNAEKPCPCSEKAQRTIVYQEHSYCKFPTNMQVESERRSQAVETEVNFGNVVSCHEIEVGQYVTLEACSSQCSSPQGMTDSRSKCFIIQDGKLNSADKKNLGAKYEIEYLQVSSLKKALDSIQSIQERIQKAAPEMVFLNFGMSEVREASSSALQFPNKIYRRLIAKCAEPLRSGSKIVIASLPLTKKNRSLNERITNFNNGIAKMTPNLKLNIELRHAEQMHPKPKEDNEFSSVEESNSWKTQDKGNQNEDIEIGNSADTQPIPVLKGNRTRSTVPTEVGTEMPVRQGIPPERTQLNDQVNYDAGKLHVQETRPDRSCLDNRISIAQAEGRTVSYPHMSNNGAGTKDAPRRKPERKTPTDADKNKISTGASMSDGCGTDVNRGTKQRCLLVHDDFLNAFDDTKFTSAVTVECFKAKSTSHLIRTGGLISRVRKVKPDVVYIHTGFEDLYKNKMSPKNLLENYTKIIYDLLESTPTKVCISSIIPIPGYPELDRDIGRANKKVVDFVTFLRNSPAYNDRIFCSCNNRVGGYVTREVGSHGIDLFVGDRGVYPRLSIESRDQENNTLTTVELSHRNGHNMIREASTAVMLENIPILSWNIHDSITSKEGPKINDDEFVATLTKSTIFCLQETKKEFFLPNYECFNSTRNDSRSGGVCIGVHRSLSKHTKNIKTECPDFQAVTFFPYDSDRKFTIINVYDSPEQSSYKARRRSNKSEEDSLSTLDQLLEFRANNTDLGDVMMVGDLNARTGNLNIDPVIEEDLEHDIPTSHPGTSERVSKDQVINSRGSKLIDFLACNRLSIMNGQTLGDIFGEYTSVNYNGASVVDYMTATPGLLESVLSFEVLNLTKFSDHKPCICKLNRSYSFTAAQVLLDELEDAPKKFKWDNQDEGLKQRFLAAQNAPDLKMKIEKISDYRCKDREEVLELNEELVSVYQELADGVLLKRNSVTKRRKAKAKRQAIKPKAPWFDTSCINAKRELNRLAKSYGKKPTDENLRNEYYDKRREYRKLIKQKKANFIKNLYEDIEAGKDVNWRRFKKIKDMKASGSKLDVFDMVNFSKFFKDLYGKPTIGQQKIAKLQEEISKETHQRRLNETLDTDITEEELESCIRTLKCGKAVSEDLISNEFLKSSGQTMRKAILNIFNQCLEFGAYPWGTSVVTPLHKKGSIYDPNNYRAIAVASNLGKLFASILLQRLIKFRAETNPDTPNQLGFCKEAQTADHILTLSTCIEKYITTYNTRLFSCFVDYAKAFDTVCREALLYKLWKMDIKGRFFDCMEYMYTHSKAKIKLLNKLSDKIEVLCGTEQGHPMSPELFKCFVHQLSEDLNSLKDIEVPVLNTVKVTHLLWADDLILLALNRESLQKMLDVLHRYCLEWGLTVNISKTAVMVFNRSGRLLKESKNLFYGERQLISVREYTYLGITFTLSGSLKSAQARLRQKGLRSYFSLKSMLDLRYLRKSMVFKLFDALIAPVLSYGSQIWLPLTEFMKHFASGSFPSMPQIAKDPIEKVHLSFLKWTLQVGKSTSNTAVWGDTGRYPLAIELLSQTFSYLQRLEGMDQLNFAALVRHAYVEQRDLELTWFSRLKSVRNICISAEQPQAGTSRAFYCSPQAIRERSRHLFTAQWNLERASNRKLGFYNSIKACFGPEPYLSSDVPQKHTKRLAEFRMSSHRYNIETGRHGVSKRGDILHRICYQCSTNDKNVLANLRELPFFCPIIEDEYHVLRTCTLYEDLRHKLSDDAKTCIFSDLNRAFEEEHLIREIAKFLTKIHERRF